jgi:hypothetical protein
LPIRRFDLREHLNFLQQTVESLAKIGAHLPIDVGREVLRVARQLEGEANNLEKEINPSEAKRSQSEQERAGDSGPDEAAWYRDEAERLRRIAQGTLDAEIRLQLLKNAAVVDLLAKQLTRDCGDVSSD